MNKKQRRRPIVAHWGKIAGAGKKE